MPRGAKNLPSLLGGKWVLIIEPSTNYRMNLKGFLANLHFKEVKIVPSVADAERELLTLQVGLVICEWILGKGNGIEFCKELKQRQKFKNLPFLLLSSENLDDDVILASESGIDGYLLKPFSFEEFKEALAKILSASHQPSKTNALLGEAAKLIDENKLKRAGQILKEVLSARPNSARAFMLMARIAVAKEDTETAIQLLNEGLQSNAKFLGTFIMLLDLYRETEDWPNFLETAKKLNSQSPQNPKYTLLLAEGFLNVGETSESETYYKRSIRLSPKMAAAHKGLGMVYMKREEFELAMRQFKKALDLDNRDVSLINALGLAYVRMGKLADAIAKYQTALQIDPGDYRILFNLGHAHERKGDLKKATLFYKQCLDRNPSFEKAKQRLDELLPVAS